MDKDWEFVILAIAGIFGAVLILPTLLPKLGAIAIEHLLAWHIVVPASEALLPIPSSGAGFDAARLLIGLGVLVVVVSVVRARARSRAQA